MSVHEFARREDKSNIQFTPKEKELGEKIDSGLSRISCQELWYILEHPDLYPNVSVVDIRKENDSAYPIPSDIIKHQYLNLEDSKEDCGPGECFGSGYNEEGINAQLGDFFRDKKRIVILVCRTGAKSYSIVYECGERRSDKDDPLYTVLNEHRIVDVKGGMQGLLAGR